MHDRYDVTEEEWAQLEPLLPDQTPRRGGRWADHRLVIHGVLWRTRISSPWRDLPSDYEHGKTVYNRHRRWSAEGIWATVLEEPRRGGDQNTQAGQSVQWSVGVESTVVRAHQHPAGAPHTPPPHLAVEDLVSTEADTGGWVEGQRIPREFVERCINKHKHFRAVATHYDKREYLFAGTLDAASIRIWLRDPVP